MIKATKSLPALTNVVFETLSKLTVERIETFFRQKTGHNDLVIPQGNLAPLFDANGVPLSSEKGKHLCLPYTHACIFANAVMEAAGKGKAKTKEEIKDLPLPFWRSTDAYLVTVDHYVIVAQRSNFNQNAPGLCLFTAAGFAQIDNGVPETAIDGVRNRLHEETGIKVDTERAAKIIQFGRDFNNAINTYTIPTNCGPLEGRVPVIAEKFAIFTKRHARDILEYINANGKNMGFIALPIKAIDRLIASEKEPASVLFAPSYDVLSRMTYPDETQTLADQIREGMHLSSLRKELKLVSRPQDMKVGELAEKDAFIRQIHAHLGGVIQAKVKRSDFDYGAVSALHYIQRAALTPRG